MGGVLWPRACAGQRKPRSESRLRAHATGAQVLWRVRSNLLFGREREFADGSYLTRIYPSQKDRRANRELSGYTGTETAIPAGAQATQSPLTGCHGGDITESVAYESTVSDPSIAMWKVTRFGLDSGGAHSLYSFSTSETHHRSRVHPQRQVLRLQGRAGKPRKRHRGHRRTQTRLYAHAPDRHAAAEDYRRDRQSTPPSLDRSDERQCAGQAQRQSRKAEKPSSSLPMQSACRRHSGPA